MGAFIVIEGGDGSGKGTQALELVTRAMQHGYNVLHISFPNYGAPSAKFIEHYLNGKYGPARDVHPELASMLYAVDRFAVSEKIREHLRKPKSLVVADRYVASNLAHQGTKVKGKAERLKFYDRVFDIEYKTLNLPKPDLNIVLLVPSSIAQENVDKKLARSYTTAKRDEHEKDSEHLEKANKNYAEIVKIYPEWFTSIPCLESDGKTMRSVEAVGADIWEAVLPILYDRS